jgi:hypothetical protein
MMIVALSRALSQAWAEADPENACWVMVDDDDDDGFHRRLLV